MKFFYHAGFVAALMLLVAGCSDKVEGVSPTVQDTTPATEAGVASEPVAMPKVSQWEGNLASLSASKLCAIDSVNGKAATQDTFQVAASEPVTFEGWAATGDLKTPATVEVVLQGVSSVAVSGTPDQTRDDVAKAYSSNALLKAGFKLTAAASSIAAGEYKIGIVHDESGTKVACATQATLVVQ